jgi:hypothetical protein
MLKIVTNMLYIIKCTLTLGQHSITLCKNLLDKEYREHIMSICISYAFKQTFPFNTYGSYFRHINASIDNQMQG